MVKRSLKHFPELFSQMQNPLQCSTTRSTGIWGIMTWLFLTVMTSVNHSLDSVNLCPNSMLNSSLPKPLNEYACFSFSSVTQSCPTLCDLMNCSTPGLPVHHQLPEFTQTHAHRVSDAIQPSHPLLSPSPLAFNLSLRVSSSHQMAKVLELQLQHQSLQWIFRTDFL